LTGGLENPFAFLLIAPVAVSASSLPLRITAALGLLAIGGASVLTAYHHPLPWFHHTDFILPRAYLMGMWASVVACIIFIGFYSWRTAEESRRMAEALAAAELVLAREQKLSALDGLAAAAAHGLGTPLATIAVVTKELLRDAKPDDAHYDDILLLRSQSDRCRDILADLAGGGDENDFIVSRLTLGHLLEEVVSPHRLVAVPIEVRTGPSKDLASGADAGPEPITQRNPGVIYGLGNLVGPSSVLTSVSQVDPIKAYFTVSEQVFTDFHRRFPTEQSVTEERKRIPLQLTLSDGQVYEHTGTISFADRQVNAATGAIRIAAVFPNPNNLLRPGGFGRVRFSVETATGALLIPQRAVTELQGSHQVAVVSRDNKVSIRPVTVGDRVGNLWIVTEGLKAGERVIVEGLLKVRDGAVVEVVAGESSRVGG